MNKPLRILQVFTIMNRGGAESMIMNYYRHMDRSKIQFDFLVHRKEKAAFDDEIEKMDGKIYRISPNKLYNNKKYTKELQKFFKEHGDKYNIIHSHLNTFSYFVLKEAAKFNIPVRIAHSHIAISKIKITDIFKKESFKNIIKNILKNKSTKYATHLLACGKDAGNWLFGKNEFKIINNAIDTSKFEFEPEISKKNKKKLKLSDQLVIGHVGRFNPQKNHDFLIDIFYEINKTNANSVLLLIGNGDLKDSIKQKVMSLNLEKSVKFLGVQSDIPFYLQAMDIFLFPSLFEGLPVTLIEAQAAGLKIIASNRISDEAKLTDLVEFVSLEKSAKDWADIVLQNSHYQRKKTARLIAEKGYDIKKNALELQNYYLNLLATKK